MEPALVDAITIGLRVAAQKVLDRIGVDEQLVTVDGRREALQAFAVVVGAHSAVDPVVPAVHAADQIRPGDMAVTQERTPVQTPSVQHVRSPVAPDDDELQRADMGAYRLVVGNVAPRGDADASFVAGNGRAHHASNRVMP